MKRTRRCVIWHRLEVHKKEVFRIWFVKRYTKNLYKELFGINYHNVVYRDRNNKRELDIRINSTWFNMNYHFLISTLYNIEEKRFRCIMILFVGNRILIVLNINSTCSLIFKNVEKKSFNPQRKDIIWLEKSYTSKENVWLI